MEENPELRQKVGEISQKAKALLEKIDSLYRRFPQSVQRKIEKQMEDKRCQNGFMHYYKLPLEDEEWRVRMSDFLHRIHLSKGSQCWDVATQHEQLYQDLLPDDHWQCIMHFLEGSIDQLGKDFEEVFMSIAAELDQGIIEISNLLSLAREKCQHLEKENNDLRLAEGYLRQSRDNLARVMVTSAIQLQEVVQDLRNTRTFLGQSKTIKGIRENVEKAMKDLWEVACPNEPPPATQDVYPPEPWPRRPQRGVPFEIIDSELDETA